jgi:hypothetical protein
MANAGPNTQGSVCPANVVLMILSRALHAAFLFPLPLDFDMNVISDSSASWMSPLGQ